MVWLKITKLCLPYLHGLLVILKVGLFSKRGVVNLLNNGSNIPFFLFFQRNRCTRESDGAVFRQKCPNHVVFEGLYHLFAGRQEGKSRFDVSLKYRKMSTEKK